MASFLDDTKNFGLMIAIIGLIAVISNAIFIFTHLDNLNGTYVGSLVVGIIYLLAGFMVYSQKPGPLASIFPEGISSKFGVLTGYIFLVGITNIILGIFTIFTDLAVAIGTIIVAVIIIAVGAIITNNTKTVLDKIIYYILIIVFLVLTVLCLIGIFGVFGLNYELLDLILVLISGVAELLMYLMAFLYLLSPEVKAKF